MENTNPTLDAHRAEVDAAARALLVKLDACCHEDTVETVISAGINLILNALSSVRKELRTDFLEQLPGIMEQGVAQIDLMEAAAQGGEQ